MTIYEGGNIHEFTWKDFQDFQGHWEVRDKMEHNRIAGTIESLMQKYEEWRMREYRAWKKKRKMSVQEYMDGAFPSKACLKRAIDSMFEPNPEYYKFIKELKRRKEVTNKMPIDYKEEWKKLRETCKGVFISCNEYGRPDSMASISSRNKGNSYTKTGTVISMHELMDNQIRDTINDREELMQEYLRTQIMTEIVKQDKEHFKVAITNAVKGHVDTIYVSRADFRNWLKNREKGGKVNAEH